MVVRAEWRPEHTGDSLCGDELHLRDHRDKWVATAGSGEPDRGDPRPSDGHGPAQRLRRAGARGPRPGRVGDRGRGRRSGARRQGHPLRISGGDGGHSAGRSLPGHRRTEPVGYGDPGRGRFRGRGDDRAAAADLAGWVSGPAIGSGPGRVLVAVYGLFALAAGARAAVQIATRFDEAPVAYTLSAFASVVYLVLTVALARGARGLALWAICIELAGVLLIGTASLVDPAAFPAATVWSVYGRGYLFIPLVLPLIGLYWLRRHPSR